MHRVLALTLLFASTAYADPDARHVDAIRTAATAYKKWHRVDERPNLAPVLCRSPLPSDYGAPSHVRMSAADDAPHGRKLYYLWASDKKLYLDSKSALPVGFTIVKESFDAVASKEPHAAPAQEPDEPLDLGRLGTRRPIDWMVTDKGERLTTGKRKDLYVMTKVGDQAGSDAGWIYGTVAPDGTVTSAGRVANCMGCHVESATHERLFGLPAAPKSW
jgi:hypothetical protein